MAYNTPRVADFAVVHNPAAATQATITQAAEATPTQPPTPQTRSEVVVQNITVSIGAAGTAQTPIQAHLRDGTTGAGTIVWSGTLAAPANSSAMIEKSNLNIVCKSGNATLEFEGAGVAASEQSVAMSGYLRSYGG